jgi:type I restriction enzyme S subunit
MSAFLKHRQEFFVIDDTERYMRVTARLHGQGVVLRDQVHGSQLRTKKQQATQASDLLVAEIDAKVGGVGIIPPELTGAIVSSHYFLYEIDETVCCPKYLECYIRSGAVEEQFQEFVQGSTNYASIRAHHTIELQIPLPPLDEQRRIVARVEELAALIEEAQGLRVKAREEAEALLAAAAKAVFDDQHWPRVTMEELVGRENLRNGKSVRATELPTDIQCLRLSSLREGLVDCNDAKPVLMTKEEAEPYLVREEDVFVVRGNGSKRLVGQAGLVRECIEGTIFPDLLVRIPVDRNRVLPSFLVAWWNSPQMRNTIEDTAKTTSGIWKINQGHIASFSVPLPPVSEQRHAVAYLDELQAQADELTALQDATQAEMDALLPSMLDRAFRGEL